MDNAQRDASASHWAEILYGTSTLYKDIPQGGLFAFKKDGPVYRKQSNGFRFADSGYRYDNGAKPGLFKTGSRTAVFRVTE